MSNAIIGALRVVLGMDSAAFEKGATKSEKRMADFEQRMRRISGNMQRIGQRMSVGITAPLVAMGYKSVAAMKVQEQAVASVQAALISMGHGAGYTIGQLEKMASAIQNESLYGDEEILSKVTANLLTFGNVQGDVFSRAQQNAVDLSARLGQDLQSSAVMLGKALNDPIKGLTALTRVGVSFTDQQQQQIKAMAKAGDVAGAQALMLDELERQYRGQAKALAETDSGKVTQAMNAIGDAFEKVGAVILPVVADLAEDVKRAAEWFQTLSPGIQSTIVTLGAFAAALGPVTLALGALVGSLTILSGPIGLAVIAAIAVIAGGVALLQRNSDASTTAIDNVTLAMGDEIEQSQLLSEALNTNGTMSVQLAQKKLQEARARHDNVAAIIAEHRALALGSDAYALLSEQIEDAQGALSGIGFPAIDAAVPSKADAFEAAQQRVVDLLRERDSLLKADQELNDQLSRTKENIAEIEGRMASAQDGVIQLGDGLIAGIQPGERLSATLGGAAGGASDLAREVDAIFDGTRTDQEQYAAKLARLNELFRTGAIDAETYKRAVAQLDEDLGKADPKLENVERGIDGISRAIGSNVTNFKEMRSAINNVLSGIASDIVSSGINGALTKAFGFAVDNFGAVLGSAFGGAVRTPAVTVPVGANANGTNNWSGGLTKINERGGEIVNLPEGTQIIPNDISKRMADNAAPQGQAVQVVPSPYFDVVVADRAAQVAGGLDMQQARQQSRAFGGMQSSFSQRGTR
ncbi:phage tail length tape measure family protein [Pseudooceanicola algae]|uniref:Bacteriophage tail tape measure N-terminal domain-containing protein n=1 Tax=Pseudooceanicola algae TaxID=1537215 RepID=A0A418SDC1_9RHOB|nr:phage tail length tape measure family protein [Pseudooceanicola algae]QPM89385.1 hypothetical protein PSAL_006010 [Pseudooceanicola algae]